VAPAALAIVHTMQGRLRLRLLAPDEPQGLVEAVRGLPGVTDCRWNRRTRGLLVLYDPGENTPDAIIQAVASHAGVTVPDPGRDPGVREETVAAAITSSVGELNARVTQATRGRLDLGVLVPLALTAWAVRELLRPGIAPLSWSSALWYAHGLFRDYALRERS